MQTQIHAPVAEVVAACTEYVRAIEAAMFPTPGVFSRCLAAEQRLIELINRRDPRDSNEPKSDEARDAEREPEGYEVAMSTRADLLAEAHAQIRHLIDDLTTAVDDDGLTRYVPPAANSLVYSNMIGALIPLATRMAEALASQPAQEQVNAQGKTNAALDTDSNTSESKQRRHMAGSLEVGQLVGERQDSRSGDIEPQGAQSLERWLCGILKPIAEDIAKNCSTVPQLVIAPLIWGISDLLKSGALCTSPPPKSDEASLRAAAQAVDREPVPVVARRFNLTERQIFNIMKTPD